MHRAYGMDVASQLPSGATIPTRRLRAMSGNKVAVPATGIWTHVQFLRFASCPICHLQLCSFADRYQEVADAGIAVVVLVCSPDNELRRYQPLLPFPVVADPDWVLYRDFGLDTGLGAIANPGTWWAAIRRAAAALHRNHPDRARIRIHDRSTSLALPADFLINPEGTVVAAHYGHHAGDQWSVGHLLDVHRVLGAKGS